MITIIIDLFVFIEASGIASKAATIHRSAVIFTLSRFFSRHGRNITKTVFENLGIIYFVIMPFHCSILLTIGCCHKERAELDDCSRLCSHTK
jgi:hypothetical protein